MNTLELAVFGLFGAALMFGAWLPQRRGIADWLMGLGGTVGAISFGVHGTADMVCGTEGPRAILLAAGMGGMGIGALLFAMGFLILRMQQRQTEKVVLPSGEGVA